MDYPTDIPEGETAMPAFWDGIGGFSTDGVYESTEDKDDCEESGEENC